MTGREDDDESQQSGALYELSSVLLNILGSPSSQYSMTRRRRPQITVAGLASLMLGISLTLMLGGSVTFMLGFMLFPWVIGLVMLFYFVAFVSCVSVIGRSLLCYAIPPPPPLSPPLSPVKDVPGSRKSDTKGFASSVSLACDGSGGATDNDTQKTNRGDKNGSTSKKRKPMQRMLVA